MELKNFFRKNILYIVLFPLILLAVYLPVVITPFYCADLEYVAGAKGPIYNWKELGRYSLILIKKIFATPYDIALEGILFSLTAFVTFSTLSYLFFLLFKKSESSILFPVCVSALIFPTFVEQFYFKFQSFEVLFGIFLLIVSAIFFVEFVKKPKFYLFIISVLLNVISFGIYQSMLNIMLVLYAGIFLMLFLNEVEYNKLKVFFLMVLQFLASFLLNTLVTKIFCTKSSYFSDKIMWKTYPFDTCYHFVKHYFRVVLLAESPMYTFSFALSLILSFIAFVYMIIKVKAKAVPAIFGLLGLMVLPFAIAIIQGFEPDSRTQLALPFSIAFLFYFAYCVFEKYIAINYDKEVSAQNNENNIPDGFQTVENNDSENLINIEKNISRKEKIFSKEFLSSLAVVLSVILLLLNIIPSYRLTYSRYVINKFDNKHLTVIAEDLKNYNCNAKNNSSLPVFFIGNLQYEDTPFCLEYDKERKDYVLISVFALDSDTIPTYFYSSNRILSAMDVLGYDYTKPNSSRYLHTAKNTAIGLPAYPEEGYIEQTDKYIVVNLGNYVSPFKK